MAFVVLQRSGGVPDETKLFLGWATRLLQIPRPFPFEEDAHRMIVPDLSSSGSGEWSVGRRVISTSIMGYVLTCRYLR